LYEESDKLFGNRTFKLFTAEHAEHTEKD